MINVRRDQIAAGLENDVHRVLDSPVMDSIIHLLASEAEAMAAEAGNLQAFDKSQTALISELYGKAVRLHTCADVLTDLVARRITLSSVSITTGS